MESQQIIEARMRESCEDLLRSIGLTASLENRAGASIMVGSQIAAVVAFNGAQMRGSVTTRSNVGFFAATRPIAPKGRADIEAMVDWAGEITNQLLGRFKNKMLAYGLDLQVGLPVTISGENLIETSAGTEGVVTYHFKAGDHRINVTLVGRLMPGASLDILSGKFVVPAGQPLDL